MNESILLTIKRMLGLLEDCDPFEPEIILHINSAIMAAGQFGLGDPGFMITGHAETWLDWLGDKASILSAVQTYVYLKVRLSWDPPANSFVVNSFQSQLDELTWRLNVQAEA